MELVQRIHFIAGVRNFTVKVVHIAGIKNKISDVILPLLDFTLLAARPADSQELTQIS